jgi:hypothetical protein
MYHNSNNTTSNPQWKSRIYPCLILTHPPTERQSAIIHRPATQFNTQPAQKSSWSLNKEASTIRTEELLENLYCYSAMPNKAS